MELCIALACFAGGFLVGLVLYRLDRPRRPEITQADWEAVGRDFAKVGEDMRRAMKGGAR